jgi:hypothetical protein
MEEYMKAKILWREIVMWDEPGGVRYKAILHMGDIVEVIDGWRYNDRTWQDKRFVKLIAKNKIGYVRADTLSQVKETTDENCSDKSEATG